VGGGRYLYEQIGSDNKTLKIYEGGYHELFNDLERETVLDDMRDWIVAHTS
jgi:acylglycerol lipase